MANIFVSIPILGKPELRMMYSLYQAIHTCGEHRVRLYYNENDSLISRVRNVHLTAFYNDYPECDYFVSLDSDIEIVNCFNTNNIFTKLLSHNLDFVGGLYALKSTEDVKCSSIPMDHDSPLEFDSGLREMRWLSSGCWCLKRDMVTKMIDAYPNLIYDGDDNASGKKVFGFYIPTLVDLEARDENGNIKKCRKYLSEDWSFAERWRKIGGKIFADTSIALRHIGKRDFNLWNVSVEVKQKPPEPGFNLQETK